MNAPAIKPFPGDARFLDEVDLLTEWLAWPGPTSRHLAQLEAAGVTTEAYIRAGHLMVPRVCTVGRLFHPDPFGDPAFVMPVYSGEPPCLYSIDETVVLADLLAFRLEEPERWWLRRGAWGSVLGKDQLVDAMMAGEAVRLHASPLDWLRAECQGACPIDVAEDHHDLERLRQEMEARRPAA